MLPRQHAQTLGQGELYREGDLHCRLDYWRRQLNGSTPLLELPADQPRQAGQALCIARLIHTLPNTLARALASLSERADVPLFVTLLAAFQTLIYRYTEQEDILVGVPAALRGSAGAVQPAGSADTLLPVRADLSGHPTFRALLSQVFRTVSDAEAHAGLSFDQLVDILHAERGSSHTPPLQVLFASQELAPTTRGAAPAPQEVMASFITGIGNAATPPDLALVVAGRADGLTCAWEYNAALFEAATISRMAGHFQALLAGIVADAAQPLARLPLLTDAEREQMVVAWNGTALPLPPVAGMHQLFEAQAARTPDAVAVVFDRPTTEDRGWRMEDGRSIFHPPSSILYPQCLTYAALDRRANQLAHELRAQGIGPETLVAVALDRTLDVPIALLGILKAGGAYVPLDPAYPQERLAFILADTQAALLITQSHLRTQLPPFAGAVLCLDTAALAARPTGALPYSGAAAQTAYLIYTSGSTGRPKGVVIAHQSALALLAWAPTAFAPAEIAGVLAATSLCFDLSIFELFVPLSLGGTVILAQNALALPDLPARQAVTLLNTVPSALAALLRSDALPSTLRTVNLAGEALPRALVAQLHARLPYVRVCNLYGPSEDTTYSTWAELARDDERVPPIGRPICNTQAYLLDQHAQPVPVGVLGEVYLGGAGLARGYLNRPDLTAEKFIPNPFLKDEGGRMKDERGRFILHPSSFILYRTGDLARYRTDGQLEFVGRIDHQVKLRGFRIELGEIESALREDPLVAAAVVVVREDTPGDQRLVGYVVPNDKGQTLNDEAPIAPTLAFSVQPSALSGVLRGFLKDKLPTYMVPAALVVLDGLPLTPNGKVDRKALPAPVWAEHQRETIAPQGPTEQALAGVWADVLAVSEVSADDNFFAIGGHSLLATRVASRVRELFQVDLPLRAFFEAPTLTDLARSIEQERQVSAEPQAPPIEPVGREASLVLSFGQQHLWLQEQFAPGNIAYNIPTALYLTGALNVAALERGLRAVVERHEALRTRFETVGDAPRQVVQAAAEVGLPIVDLRPYQAEERMAEARRLMIVEARQPFDLTTGPLLRARLFRLDKQMHILLLTIHHIVSDDWSLSLILHDLAAVYSGAALPPLALQYADFSAWQRGWLNGARGAGHLAFWTEHLANAPTLLDIPTDRPHPAAISFQGARLTIPLPSGLTAAVNTWSRQRGATLFMTLLAAFEAWLGRLTGQDDFVVGTPIANRTRAETEELVGLFTNTLALRADLSEDPTFAALVARVRDTCLAAYAHQETPFEQVVEAVRPVRTLNRAALVQVLLVVQNAPAPPRRFGDAEVRTEELDNGSSKCDLSLYLTEQTDGLVGTWEYNTDVFDAATVARMAQQFVTLLAAAVAEPETRLSTLPLLSPDQARTLLVDWNATHADYPQDRCLHHLIEAQVARTPDALAVQAGGDMLSYRALDQRANQLAGHLRSLGVGPERVVAICVERSLEMLVGLLGVLKAGGAYLPLDPAYPQERLAFLLQDAQPMVLLTATTDHRPPTTDHRPTTEDRGLKIEDSGADAREMLSSILYPPSSVVDLIADWPTIAQAACEAPPNSATSENLAYMIYTSGSTGRPKGVQVLHRAVVNFLATMRRQPGMTNADILLAVTTLSFDIAALELFLPLTIGARVVLASRATAADGPQLGVALAASGATVMQATPATWRVLLEAGWGGAPRLRMWCGGEALPRELATRLLERGAELWNLYGPTETTIWSAAGRVPVGDLPIALGQPIANTQLYVLDRRYQPVPIDVPGELCVGGDGLARGYWRRPGLTAERFVPNPFAGAGDKETRRQGDDQPATQHSTLNTQNSRLYKTGDLVRRRADSSIEYLGRMDQQVKLRGFRIELGEIEALLRQHAAVRDVVVVLREDRPGDQRLVAYIVPKIEDGGWKIEDRQPATSEMPSSILHPPSSILQDLRAFLKDRLPEYMLPAAFVLLEALPQTPNRKIDRRALPAPAWSSHAETEEQGAPRNPLEELLAGIWSQTLGLERVGRHDNFFALGGHSLLGTQLIARVRSALQVDLPLRSLFASPTIVGQAQQIEVARQTMQGVSAPPIRPVARDGQLPLSFAQQRLWFLDQLAPGDMAYNATSIIRLLGDLDADALRYTLSALLRRHESLRTRFVLIEESPVQVIMAPAELDLPSIDLRGLPNGLAEAALQRLAADEARRSFDLTQGSALRMQLVQLDEAAHALLLTIHHIISDGWSLGIFYSELSQLYRAFTTGQPAPLPELPIQYADYAVWQRQRLQGDVLETMLTYWKQQLADAPPLLDLPTDRPRLPTAVSQGTHRTFSLPAALSEAIRTLSRQEGATLFMTLLAAFQTLLHGYTQQDDICVGSPIANRNRAEIEGLIGFFVNTLVMRARLSGDLTFRALLHRVREVALGAYDHQDLPFERLVEELRPERDPSHSPLFQVMFVLQNAARPALQLAELTTEMQLVDGGGARFDLTLSITDRPQGLAGVWEYNTYLFDEATISQMTDDLLALLSGISANPDSRIAELTAHVAHRRAAADPPEQIVELRGYRIRPAQVTRALRRHPAVADATTVLREDMHGGPCLVAYVVPKLEDGGWKIEDRQSGASEAPSSILHPPSSIVGELRTFLKQTLPQYMRPAVFVLLDALPTTDGTVDPQALPAPGAPQTNGHDRGVFVQTSAETADSELSIRRAQLSARQTNLSDERRALLEKARRGLFERLERAKAEIESTDDKH